MSSISSHSTAGSDLRRRLDHFELFWIMIFFSACFLIYWSQNQGQVVILPLPPLFLFSSIKVSSHAHPYSWAQYDTQTIITCMHRVNTGIPKPQEETAGRDLFVCLVFEKCLDTVWIGLLNYQEGNICNFAIIYRAPLFHRGPSWKGGYDNLLCSPAHDAGAKFYILIPASSATVVTDWKHIL